MDAQPWLDQLRAELARHKLPPHYVERLVGELSDHLTHLMEDRMSTDAKDLQFVTDRLGLPDAIANSAATQFRRQRFSRRHPFVTFALLPALSLLLLWACAFIAFLLSAGAISWLNGKPEERFPNWFLACTPAVVSVLVFMPILLAAAWFCRVAARARLGWKWPVVACLILAVMGGTAFFDVKLPSNHHGVLQGAAFHNPPTANSQKGSLAIGFGLNQYPRPWQILQFCLPLLVCGWFAWRYAGQQAERALLR